MNVDSQSLIVWLVVGAIAGFIASWLMGTRENLILMIVLGIVGGVVGGFLANALFGAPGVTGINLMSVVVAVIGAIVVIFIYDAATDRRLMGRGRRL